MAFIYKVFVVLLVLLHWTAGQDTANDTDERNYKTRLSNRPDIDINWTVGEICNLLDDLYCIQSANVYILAEKCLIQYGNSTNEIAFGLCPYFSKKLSWFKSPFSIYYSLPSNRSISSPGVRTVTVHSSDEHSRTGVT